MGYAFIPIVVSIFLALQHVGISDASRKSKVTVFAIVLSSLAIWRYFPQWLVFATVLQVVVSIYMLLYLKLREGAA